MLKINRRSGDFLRGHDSFRIRPFHARRPPGAEQEGTVAKQDFLDNVRVARNLFAHPRVQVNGPQVAPESMERQMARAAIWLTPKSVAGFSVDDFSELGPNRKRELADAVQEFLAVAKQVPPAVPATRHQREKASLAFVKLLEILAPYLPTHEEAVKVQDALQTVEFPEWVANWNYELGSDADDLPAVWVTLFVDEQSAPMKQLGRLALGLTALIQRALAAAGITRWPYLRVRTAVEHKSMV
jgi:hypothetical protein